MAIGIGVSPALGGTAPVTGGSGTSGRTSSKSLSIVFADGTVPLTAWQPNYIAQSQSARDQLDSAYWFNGKCVLQGLSSTARGVFVPTFSFVTDATHANCLLAAANAVADRNGLKWISTFAEPEIDPGGTSGTGVYSGTSAGVGYSVADVVAAWGAIVNDSAFSGDPSFRFISPYTSHDGTNTSDGGTLGSFYRDFLAGVAAAGFRAPDAHSNEKYATNNNNPASMFAAFKARFDNYRNTFGGLQWGFGMSILGGAAASDAIVTQTMQLIYDYMENQGWIYAWAWWFMGPQGWSPFAASNAGLFDGVSTPPAFEPIGTYHYNLFHNNTAPTNFSTVANAAIFANASIATVVQAVQSDVGVTVATGVSQWNDQSGNTNHYTQATTTKQPALIANALNGLPVITGDGVDDVLASALPQLSVPSATGGSTIWFVFKQNAWVAAKNIMGASNGDCGLATRTSSPNMNSQNGTNGPLNAGAPVGTWTRGIMMFNGGTSDYLKLGSTTTTGTNTGTAASSPGFSLFGIQGLAQFYNCSFAAVVIMRGNLAANDPVIVALDAAAVTKYGGLVAM
jgi:hypothetical protein